MTYSTPPPGRRKHRWVVCVCCVDMEEPNLAAQDVLGDFGEDLFSGTRSRVRAVNTEGYVAKRDDPLWFNGPVKQSSAEERRKTLKARLDYLYYSRDWQGVVELSTQMIGSETKKDNSLYKELIETKARALMNLKRHADAAKLLDEKREEFHCSDLEVVYCLLRGSCVLELGLTEQAMSHFWRVVTITPEHVACWMKLTEVLMGRKDSDVLVSELTLLCALHLKAILARIAAFPGRKSSGKLSWSTTYSADAAKLVDVAVAAMAARGVHEREGLVVHDWCERARQAGWNAEELQVIAKCLAVSANETTPAEDINPVGL